MLITNPPATFQPVPSPQAERAISSYILTYDSRSVEMKALRPGTSDTLLDESGHGAPPRKRLFVRRVLPS